MLTILEATELDNQQMTIKQRFRISGTRKAFAVFIDDNLYLVNDLERLFFDRLRAENIYNAQIYQLK
jgi:hypothetical protein